MLFIDEIHRLNPAVEEILYPALEDCQLDLMIGEGPAARSVRIDLPPFTLVGATTRAGLLTTPLRERFGIPLRLRILRAVRNWRVIVARNQPRLLWRFRQAEERRAGDRRGVRAARRGSPGVFSAGSTTSQPSPAA